MKPACGGQTRLFSAGKVGGGQRARQSARERRTRLLYSPGDAEDGRAHHGVPHGESEGEQKIRLWLGLRLRLGQGDSYMVTMLGFLDEASELFTLKAEPSGQ